MWSSYGVVINHARRARKRHVRIRRGSRPIPDFTKKKIRFSENKPPRFKAEATSIRYTRRHARPYARPLSGTLPAA
jgi:hypothetical protein